MSNQKVTSRFDHMKIYGKSFTDHHKTQIFVACGEVVLEFVNWLHRRGYTPVPFDKNKTTGFRKWIKKGVEISESRLYIKFINDKKQNQSITMSSTTKKVVFVFKSGRAFNGAHRDAGIIIHIIDANEKTSGGFSPWIKSYCGTSPGIRSNGWANSSLITKPTCQKCIDKFNKTINNNE